MNTITTDDLKLLLTNNLDLMSILTIIDELQLNDCWLCAGTLRNFVWNHLSGNQLLDLNSDIDVIFYDDDVSRETVSEIEQQLLRDYPQYQWEVRNQVYMHHHSLSTEPYKNSQEAMTKFPEQCTAIGARLNGDQIEIFAPFGIEDIVNFKVQPTPFYLENAERRKLYSKRVQSKNWKDKWENLTIVLIDG